MVEGSDIHVIDLAAQPTARRWYAHSTEPAALAAGSTRRSADASPSRVHAAGVHAPSRTGTRPGPGPGQASGEEGHEEEGHEEEGDREEAGAQGREEEGDREEAGAQGREEADREEGDEEEGDRTQAGAQGDEEAPLGLSIETELGPVGSPAGPFAFARLAGDEGVELRRHLVAPERPVESAHDRPRRVDRVEPGLGLDPPRFDGR